ncbi:GDP-mannose 4,6-dehydratase [Candidatus Gottesmanbacteria bacterium]|nr:GDP-mannose 4,6-dehydratase [Candidatus Gottesmanbacteria bacterium]
MKLTIVAGGAGFIGTNLCKKLIGEGHRVLAIDNLITSSDKNLKSLLKNPRFRFIKHDIVKPIQSVLRTINYELKTIYHLACPTGVANIKKFGEEMLLTSSLGTFNILELAREHRAKVLFTSSSEVYGQAQVFPQAEDYFGYVDPIGYRSPYEEGKRFAESLIMSYVRKFGLDAKIVRVFNTYGPGMSGRDSRVIPKFLRLAQENKPLTVEGDGSQTRTFCFIDDLINGLLIVGKKGKKGEVYNLGSNQEITISDLSRLIIKITGSKSKIRYVKRPIHDHQRRLPDVGKIKKLGWNKTITLSAGLQKTWDWYKNVRYL